MERKTIEIFVGVITIVIGAIWWVTGDGSWEPLLVIITAAVLLLYGIFFEKNEDKKPSRTIKMKQKGGKNSTNIQVGGNYKIHKPGKDAQSEA